MHSSGTEGLAMAMNIFDKLESKREKEQDIKIETSRFIIYVTNSPPYELPVEFVPKYVGLKMDEILNKLKMANSRDLPKMPRQQGGIMD